MRETERTWAEIDLGSILHNYKELRARLLDGTRFLGVVKADAYGHGAVPVARLLEENGCEYLAVAALSEAVELRENGIKAPILILGRTPHSCTDELIKYGITQSVVCLDDAKAISGIAEAAGKKLKVHLKADSGMGRLGAVCHSGCDASGELLEIMHLPGLDIEGIFTHFAVSELDDDGGYTKAQFSAFTELISRLENASGMTFAIKHCANSGAMVNYREMQLDMVRPGIALYGCYPGDGTGGLDLRETISLKTRIVQIKDFAPGMSVSYGRTYTAESARKIAVIPVGYADGLHRVSSGKLEFLLRGKRVKQVGRICMDMCMIDVTDVDAAVGDVVTLFGHDGDSFISIEEAARAAGTISYEIMCSVSKRVPRIYL